MSDLSLLQQWTNNLPLHKKQELRRQLASYLNHLLLNDFSTLVQLLYTADVPEKKVNDVLKQHPQEDAGTLLADLLIQRQEEKLASRQSFQFPSDSSDEERW